MRFRAYKSSTLAALAALLIGGSGAVGSSARRVVGHVPTRHIAKARHLGRHTSGDNIHIAVSLAMRDPGGLADYLKGLYDPSDSRYHQFLTPAEARQRFAPTDADVANVVSSLRARGLTVTKVHENNLLIEVRSPASVVEQAFQVELHDYQTADGRVAFAPIGEPLVQGEGADKVQAVNGLNSFVRRHTHRLSGRALDPRTGTINDYMTPAKIRTAYNVSAIGLTGAGETLALFELDGYAASDIAAYVAQFNISPAPVLQNQLVVDSGGTASGVAGADTGEVCLDIEVAMAIAPGLSKIIVYEGENSDPGVLAAYSKIETDNQAKEVSTSWGYYEAGNLPATLTSEKGIFDLMATHGQSVFAASGDNGAYDDPNDSTVLAVDDPASQLSVTGVGGTSLTANATTGAYGSETAWGDVANTEGGGGGNSSQWLKPAWQNGFATIANGGIATQRMVPDVSLDADPNTGYPIYYSGAWHLVGGTSAAAPLWAAYTAIVNQGRLASGQTRVGFMNTALYGFAASGSYPSLFHDIADNSTNLHFPSVTGYDLATGLGSFNGLNLYKAFVGPAAPGTITLTPGATSITIGWAAVAGATSYKVYRAASASGPFTAIATGVAGLSFIDTTSVAVNYYYVAAVNAVSEGAGSTLQSGAVAQAAPATPTGLTGAIQ